MSEEIIETLEQHSSNRAYFDNINEPLLHRLMDTLRNARATANGEPEEERKEAYQRTMIQVRSLFFYDCGEAGIDEEEAKRIWWSYVHGNPAPVDRNHLV